MSEIKLLGSELIVTHSDEVWEYDGNTDEWVQVGPFPGSSSSAMRETTWGQIKGEYAR